MKGSGDIRRWNNDAVGGKFGGFVSVEITVLHPPGIKVSFRVRRVEMLTHCVFHGALSPLSGSRRSEVRDQT